VELVIIEGQPPQTPPPFAIPMMVKNYSVQTPFDPESVDTPVLKTMLIPLKAVVSEINQYIQKIEQVLRERK
jgi:hypothetical protein